MDALAAELEAARGTLAELTRRLGPAEAALAEADADAAAAGAALGRALVERAGAEWAAREAEAKRARKLEWFAGRQNLGAMLGRAEEVELDLLAAEIRAAADAAAAAYEAFDVEDRRTRDALIARNERAGRVAAVKLAIRQTAARIESLEAEVLAATPAPRRTLKDRLKL